MSGRAKLSTRIAARLAGEVSADTAEAYRQAGAGVYDLLLECEQRRSQGSEGADGSWLSDASAGTLFLCTWCAFALQTLGDSFVDADYRATPRTAGFLPPVTANQALLFYGEVEDWLGRARAAEASTAFSLDVRLPARLPGWVEVEPCPHEHLVAMQDGCRALREHAELAVADLERAAGADRQDSVARVREQLAQMASAADYAEELHRGQMTAELHRRVEATIKRAVEGAYRVGQLAAMPDLIDRAAEPRRLAAPGEPGFDPWCLTDPESREQWQRDAQARRAIELLWHSDPNPQRTLEIQAEIDELRDAGQLQYASSRGRRLGHYYCCPWSPIYEANRSVTIAGRRLAAGDQFTFDVSAEELLEGGEFKRELVVGDFSPTSEVDYCDPRAG